MPLTEWLSLVIILVMEYAPERKLFDHSYEGVRKRDNDGKVDSEVKRL